MHSCPGAYLASALLQGCNDGVLLSHQALLQGQLRPSCSQLSRLLSSSCLRASSGSSAETSEQCWSA